MLGALGREKEFKELFSVPGGINEFEVLFVDGSYYIAFHPYEEPKPRIFRIENLDDFDIATAESADLPAVYYPTLLFVDGEWHLWGWTTGNGIEHWVARNWRGPYQLQGKIDNTIGLRGDPHVRKSPDGTYILAYKYAQAPYWAGLMTAPSPNGPWTDRGPIFAKRDDVHAGEEADPAVHFFMDGSIYLTFAAWNGDSQHIQQVAGVELDQNLKPIGSVRILIKPEQPWQQRNGSRKVFNPIIVEHPHGQIELFYAHNPSAKNVQTGWGRVRIR